MRLCAKLTAGCRVTIQNAALLRYQPYCWLSTWTGKLLTLTCLAVRRLVESRTVQQNDSKWKRQIEQIRASEEHSGTVNARTQMHVDHITEKILTTTCPRGHAFTNFTGCFALVCTRCKPQSCFCGWCLSDCGGDAHAHVARCPQRISGGSGNQSYYGSQEQFEIACQRRKKSLLQDYWKERVQADEQDVQEKVKERIKPLVVDLKLSSSSLSITRSRATKSGTKSDKKRKKARQHSSARKKPKSTATVIELL